MALGKLPCLQTGAERLADSLPGCVVLPCGAGGQEEGFKVTKLMKRCGMTTGERVLVWKACVSPVLRDAADKRLTTTESAALRRHRTKTPMSRPVSAPDPPLLRMSSIACPVFYPHRTLSLPT